MTGRSPPGRLTKRSQYLAVASGRRYHTERMTIQVLRRADDSPQTGLRFGFTVTRKSGHATERNRIRRRLKAAAAESVRPFAALAADIVVIGRAAAIDAPYPVLVGDLGQALERVAAGHASITPSGARPPAARPSSNAGARRRGRSRPA